MNGDGNAGDWIDLEEAGCRLLFLVNAANAAAIEQYLPNSAIAACVLDPNLADLADWIEEVRAHGMASLLEGDVVTADRLGADGVLLGDRHSVASARTMLGPDALIGVHCSASRHELMLAGESETDFVVLANDAPALLVELVSWWHDVAVLPIAVQVPHGAVHLSAGLRAAGADFLILDCLDEAVLGGLG